MYGRAKFSLKAFPSYPEAQTSSDEMAVTPVRRFVGLMPSCREGVETYLHAVPSQWAAFVVCRAESPTAQASFGAIATTPHAPSRPPIGVGDGEMVHEVPSQCSRRNSIVSVAGLKSHPAAQMSEGPTPDTLVRRFADRVPCAGFGLGTMVHVDPS